MKKLIFLGLVLALGAAAQAHADFNVNLSYGSTNTAEVVKLQEFLVSKGFLNVAPTGSYYNVTRQAVAAFQSANGINPNGVFGPATRAMANSQLVAAVPQASVQAQSISNITNTATAALVNSKRVSWVTANYPNGAGVDLNLIRRTEGTPSQFVFVRKLAVNTANDGEEVLSLRRGEAGANYFVEVTCSSTFAFENGCQLNGSPLQLN